MDKQASFLRSSLLKAFKFQRAELHARLTAVFRQPVPLQQRKGRKLTEFICLKFEVHWKIEIMSTVPLKAINLFLKNY